MNMFTLKYALEVEKAGTISKAAANLYVAQPNLSKAIKDLEEEIGYEIFTRTATGVKVTVQGERFLFHARKILEQVEAIEKIAGQDTSKERRFKLSIPRGSYIASGFTDFVASMSKEGSLEITINETNNTQTIENVAKREYNMGIIRYPVSEEYYYLNYLKNNRLTSETIWEFDYVLVMSENHPLASKDDITPPDLKPYVRIAHGDVESIGQSSNRVLSELKDAGDNDKIIYVYERGSQFDLLENVQDTYMWVSPIPESYLMKKHLIQRSCKMSNNTYKDVLIYRSDYTLGENDRLFQKKLYESKVDVSSEVIK